MNYKITALDKNGKEQILHIQAESKKEAAAAVKSSGLKACDIIEQKVVKKISEDKTGRKNFGQHTRGVIYFVIAICMSVIAWWTIQTKIDGSGLESEYRYIYSSDKASAAITNEHLKKLYSELYKYSTTNKLDPMKSQLPNAVDSLLVTPPDHLLPLINHNSFALMVLPQDIADNLINSGLGLRMVISGHQGNNQYCSEIDSWFWPIKEFFNKGLTAGLYDMDKTGGCAYPEPLKAGRTVVIWSGNNSDISGNLNTPNVSVKFQDNSAYENDRWLDISRCEEGTPIYMAVGLGSRSSPLNKQRGSNQALLDSEVSSSRYQRLIVLYHIANIKEGSLALVESIEVGRIVNGEGQLKLISPVRAAITEAQVFQKKIMPSDDFQGIKQYFTAEEVLTKNDIVYNKQTSEPLNGWLQTFYSTGQLKSALPYKQGKIHGRVREFYLSGKKKQFIKYRMGMKNGSADEYYKYGSYKKRSHFLSGKITGEQQYYNRVGVVTKKINYKFDQKHGFTTTYYSTGEKQWSVMYQSDLLNGDARQYYRSGELKNKFFFKNGELIFAKFYSKDGTKRILSPDDIQMSIYEIP